MPPHDSVRPLVPRNWISPGNVTFRSSDRMSPRYHFSGPELSLGCASPVPMALPRNSDGHQTQTPGRGDRGGSLGGSSPRPFNRSRTGVAGSERRGPRESGSRARRAGGLCHREYVVRHSQSPVVRWCRLAHYWPQCFRYCTLEVSRICIGDLRRVSVDLVVPDNSRTRRCA